MITREQVADLQPGDVVELSGYPALQGLTVRGPLVAGHGRRLSLGRHIVRSVDGGTPTLRYSDGNKCVLTVVSRAPRLYVNHPRTEPVAGDVAVCADGSEPEAHTYHHLGDEGKTRWWRFDDAVNTPPSVMRLLVDGETGQVVQ